MAERHIMINGHAPHVFDSTLLREYDVRGVVGETLFPGDAWALGRAFGSLARDRGAQAIAVGYDGRHSSPMLAEALTAGLVASGVDAIDVGRGPTPMLYFACHALKVEGGVMVTGSHNPPSYNGFKLTLHGAPFYGADIRELGKIAATADYRCGGGRIAQAAVYESYVARVLEGMTGQRSLKVAWDAGNGAMGEAMASVAARLPGRHILLNERIDGDFPSHHPDPTVPDNLAQLQATVLREGCDLGVAFDGDGDRLGVIDSKGRILWGDQVLLYLARDVLARRPGAMVIGDIKCSQLLFDGIAALGGQPLMWKTGHSLIKAEMKRRSAILAGEMSGHFFLADEYFGYDDGLYAAVRLISILQGAANSLADFKDSLPAVANTPEIRVTCPEDRKRQVVEEVKARQLAKGREVVDIDGVRVNGADGWWLLRASNTQDVVVVRCEAADAGGLQVLEGEVRQELEACGLKVLSPLFAGEPAARGTSAQTSAAGL